MQRKRWTKKEDTEHTETIRAKRKWQIALRRYVLEGQKSYAYAPFFGVDAATFRKWIELQFSADMQWDNFSDVWQFDHIVPVAYFDFDNQTDMKLCWNYLNIRPEPTNSNKNRSARVDVIAAKTYFQELHKATQLQICQEMIRKIEAIELSQISLSEHQLSFLQANRDQLDTMATFDAADFDRLNTGTSYTDLAFEKQFLRKFA